MIETEWNVLGALMLDNSLVAQYPFEPGDFQDQQNATIYANIRALVEKGEPADAVKVADAAGVDLSHTASLANESSAASNMAAYHKSIRRDGRLRSAHSVAELLGEAKSPEDIEKCVNILTSLTFSEQSNESDLPSAIRRTIDHLSLLETGVDPGLTTGLEALDEKLGGLQPGDLTILAGRSGHGKTALMMHIANSQKGHVGIISIEQPTKQLVMRSIAMTGGVSLQRMRTGKLDDVDWGNVDRGVKKLQQCNHSIFDKGGTSIAEILAMARQWKFNKDMTLLIVDYLQLVTGGDGNQHRLQIGDIARKLKSLAKQLQIPVIALAQIVREVDKRPQGTEFLGRMPYTVDLADSAQIEDAGDQIITLYRPAEYWPKNEDLRGHAYLNVCKNRHGPKGWVRCEWVSEFVQFRNKVA